MSAAPYVSRVLLLLAAVCAIPLIIGWSLGWLIVTRGLTLIVTTVFVAVLLWMLYDLDTRTSRLERLIAEDRDDDSEGRPR